MAEAALILVSMAGFGVVHSWLASPAVKTTARRVFGDRHSRGWYRLLYNGFAVISLLPALALVIALPDRELYRIQPPLWYAALGAQVLAGLGMAYSLFQFDALHFTGLRQWIGWLNGIEVHSESDTSASRLVVDGLHRYVRHPLYTTSLIVLWLVSPMTVNRLAFVVGITIYFYIGSVFEERKLVAEFGQAYRDYQRRVPRLVPNFRPKLTASS
jgi:protein-S-isoprenylcysteine O-methyltransferase Ste14